MPQLGRLYHPVTDSSGNGISGASVTVYREGSTVNGNQTGASPFTVTVLAPGKISRVSTSPDVIFINSTTGTTYSGYASTSTTIILSGFDGILSLTSGDRLISGNLLPTLYSDDQGNSTLSNPLTTKIGRASCRERV